MSENIFCTNCGNTLKVNSEVCSCGNVMSLEVRNEIANKVSKIENFKLITNSPENKIKKIQDELPDYYLSKKYYRGSSAKKDFTKKVNYIKNKLIPEITEWKDKVEEADRILANDKVELYGRILGITEFVINDVFGRFNNKNKHLGIFAELRDFSKYELSKVMHDYNIELDDIQTVNFETIGIDVFNSIGNTLHNGSFLKLSNKDSITDADIRGVKAEIGVAIAGELINGISNMISQNSDAIRNVREADSNLNEKLEHISNVSSSLRIEEQEINKHKQLFDKSDLLIDTCYNNIMKPIVFEFQNDPTFLEYKNLRKPFDLQQDKIEIENQALMVDINISFWGCLLKNSKRNFNSYLNKRLKFLNSHEEYYQINDVLKEKNHKSLDLKLQYEIDTLEAFKQFETVNRRILRKLPIVTNNNETVQKFLSVLKTVRTNIKK